VKNSKGRAAWSERGKGVRAEVNSDGKNLTTRGGKGGDNVGGVLMLVKP